jgi:hypothetical protein
MADQNAVLLHQICVAANFRWVMETLRKKSFCSAMVFIAVFVASIVVLLADKAMAR